MRDEMTETSLLSVSSSYDVASNSTRLIWTRWAAACVVWLATFVCTHVLRLPLPEGPLYAIGAWIMVYNGVILYWQVRRSPPLDDPHFDAHIRRLVLWQIALDWLSMTLFLHFTGGITSPAVSFFFLHVVMVVVTLPDHAPFYAGLATVVIAMLTLLEATGLIQHWLVIPGIPADLHANPVYATAVIVFTAIGLFATVFITAGIMDRLRERERHVAALLQTARAVNSTLDLEAVLQRLAQNASVALSVRGASIRLLEGNSEQLKIVAAHGLSRMYLNKGPVELSNSELDQEALSGRYVIICDPSHDPRVQYPEEIEAEGIQSILVVPIISTRRSLGVLRVYSDASGCFNAEDADFLTAVAEQGATAIENALAHEQLASADEERETFVRTVTHELRAPVTGAQSLTRVLLRGMAGEMTDQQRDIISRLETRLESLLALINDLLSLATSKAVDMHQHPRPVSLTAVLQQIKEQYTYQAEEKGVQLWFEIPSTPLTVKATEDGLVRIFDNLIGNAIKYTSASGTVMVDVEAQPHGVTVEVTDTGIGIPQDVLEHLGEEFYRAPNAKEAGISGTGLGMAIVKELVAYFGGHWDVESTLGEGTKFTVHFPLASAAEVLPQPTD
jgi:signal transduction histidine kinase